MTTVDDEDGGGPAVTCGRRSANSHIRLERASNTKDKVEDAGEEHSNSANHEVIAIETNKTEWRIGSVE